MDLLSFFKNLRIFRIQSQSPPYLADLLLLSMARSRICYDWFETVEFRWFRRDFLAQPFRFQLIFCIFRSSRKFIYYKNYCAHNFCCCCWFYRILMQNREDKRERRWRGIQTERSSIDREAQTARERIRKDTDFHSLSFFSASLQLLFSSLPIFHSFLSISFTVSCPFPTSLDGDFL